MCNLVFETRIAALYHPCKVVGFCVEEASLHEGGGLSIGLPSQRTIHQQTNPLLVQVHHILHLIQTQYRLTEDQDPRYDATNVANLAMYSGTATALAPTSMK